MDTINDSILLTTKKLLGLAPEYTHFDVDIMIAINSALLILCQLGVGPSQPFKIFGNEELWSDFLEDEDFEAVKSYVYLKTRLMFDPPTGTVLECIKETIAELEWRLTNNHDILNAGGSDGE